MNCTKAIIAVGGYGTRRLPITKAIDKCMLPLLNRPFVDYVVEDCMKAGITDIYFVISKGAAQLKGYYSRNEALEDTLERAGKHELRESIIPPDGIRFHFVEQDLTARKYGTTIPVALAKQAIGECDEPILIVMGDQVLFREDAGSDMLDLMQQVERSEASSGLVGRPVADERVHNYGIIETNDMGMYERILEKPAATETTSRLSNSSIYVVEPKFFDYVMANYERKDMAGEYLLTDVVNDYVNDSHDIVVYSSKGVYLDSGSVEYWLEANNYMTNFINQNT